MRPPPQPTAYIFQVNSPLTSFSYLLTVIRPDARELTQPHHHIRASISHHCHFTNTQHKRFEHPRYLFEHKSHQHRNVFVRLHEASKSSRVVHPVDTVDNRQWRHTWLAAHRCAGCSALNRVVACGQAHMQSPTTLSLRVTNGVSLGCDS